MIEHRFIAGDIEAVPGSVNALVREAAPPDGLMLLPSSWHSQSLIRRAASRSGTNLPIFTTIEQKQQIPHGKSRKDPENA
jgi:hypothetical protein